MPPPEPHNPGPATHAEKAAKARDLPIEERRRVAEEAARSEDA